MTTNLYETLNRTALASKVEIMLPANLYLGHHFDRLYAEISEQVGHRLDISITVRGDAFVIFAAPADEDATRAFVFALHCAHLEA